MGTFRRVLVYAFGLGMPIGAAVGAASGKGLEHAALGAAVAVGVYALMGLVFIGAESAVSKMPPRVQRVLLRRVIPGESIISTGPLADAGTQPKRD